MKRYIKNIKPYKSVSQCVYDYESFDDVLKMDWNESLYSPPPEATANLIKYLSDNNCRINWYTDIEQKELKNILKNYYKLDPTNFELTAGSDYALELISKVFLNNGDNVTFISPTYDQFRVEVIIQGCNFSKFFPKNIFRITQKDIEEAIANHNSNLIYLVNPNNPTGWYLDKKSISNLCANNPDVTFIIDEAYIEFTNFKSCISLSNKFQNIIITRSFSKAFALAGARLGSIISSKENILKINSVRNPKNINVFSQKLAISALNNREYYTEKILEVNNGRNYAYNQLKAFGIEAYNTPCNFLLFKPDNFKALFNYLKDNKIYIRDLSHLEGLKGFLRMTCGNIGVMDYVINTIKKFYNG
tara:strand:+ start:1483 stop:2562 length:1080 start_codon:yes stop_codon:yes gene_type:complete